MRAGCGIADLQNFVDIALGPIATGFIQYCAQCRLQTGAIAGLLAHRDVGLQAVERAAPIGAPPGRSLIHSALAGARQPEWHRVAVFRPDVADVAIAELRARNALDIGGQSFLQPMVATPQFRQRQVHHFMHQDPVIGQFARSGIAADADLDEEPGFIGGAAAVHAAARGALNFQQDQRRRKAAVIIGNDSRRPLDPLPQHRALQRHGRVIDQDAQAAALHAERNRRVLGAGCARRRSRGTRGSRGCRQHPGHHADGSEWVHSFTLRMSDGVVRQQPPIRRAPASCQWRASVPRRIAASPLQCLVAASKTSPELG